MRIFWLLACLLSASATAQNFIFSQRVFLGTENRVLVCFPLKRHYAGATLRLQHSDGTFIVLKKYPAVNLRSLKEFEIDYVVTEEELCYRSSFLMDRVGRYNFMFTLEPPDEMAYASDVFEVINYASPLYDIPPAKFRNVEASQSQDVLEVNDILASTAAVDMEVLKVDKNVEIVRVRVKSLVEDLYRLQIETLANSNHLTAYPFFLDVDFLRRKVKEYSSYSWYVKMAEFIKFREFVMAEIVLSRTLSFRLDELSITREQKLIHRATLSSSFFSIAFSQVSVLSSLKPSDCLRSNSFAHGSIRQRGSSTYQDKLVLTGNESQSVSNYILLSKDQVQLVWPSAEYECDLFVTSASNTKERMLKRKGLYPAELEGKHLVTISSMNPNELSGTVLRRLVCLKDGQVTLMVIFAI